MVYFWNDFKTHIVSNNWTTSYLNNFIRNKWHLLDFVIISNFSFCPVHTKYSENMFISSKTPILSILWAWCVFFHSKRILFVIIIILIAFEIVGIFNIKSTHTLKMQYKTFSSLDCSWSNGTLNDVQIVFFYCQCSIPTIQWNHFLESLYFWCNQKCILHMNANNLLGNQIYSHWVVLNGSGWMSSLFKIYLFL